MSKQCPQCARIYRDDDTFCSKDGSPLILSEAIQHEAYKETLKLPSDLDKQSSIEVQAKLVPESEVQKRMDALKESLKYEHESDVAAVKRNFKSQIDGLKRTHESQIATLNIQHQNEIINRRGAFDSLKHEKDIIEERLASWERYAWLVGIAGEQERNILQYVKLESIERGDVRLHNADGVPFIRFHFNFINNSVFDVAIELKTNARDSYITFGLQDGFLELGETYIGKPDGGLLTLSNGKRGDFTIEQRLSPMEAHCIARREGQDDAIFYFDRLVITVKGLNQYPHVDERRLVIDKAVSLNNDLIPVRR